MKVTLLVGWVCLAACGTDTTTGGVDTQVTSSDTDVSAADSALASDTAPIDSAVAFDSAAPGDSLLGDSDRATDSSTLDVDSDTAEVMPDTSVEDVADVPAVVACETPSLVDQYPPPLPPFPYGIWPIADGCFSDKHDVVIVLGCPSESNGDPSTCQTKRAEMADQLYEAGWADHFITSGAAVHTPYVEADALAALLIARGIPADAIVTEPQAQHTDENIYYSTRIMEEHGWLSAIVVSDDPAHLMYTGLCDADCCVKLGRMTLRGFPVGGITILSAGHYVLSPPGQGTSDAECTHIKNLVLCANIADRKACKDNFQLDP